MAKILAKSLFNKNVMLMDGSRLGVATNVIMDSHGGELVYLVVKPDIGVDIEKYEKQDNSIKIPFQAVRAAKDYALVDETLLGEDTGEVTQI